MARWRAITGQESLEGHDALTRWITFEPVRVNCRHDEIPGSRRQIVDHIGRNARIIDRNLVFVVAGRLPILDAETGQIGQRRVIGSFGRRNPSQSG